MVENKEVKKTSCTPIAIADNDLLNLPITWGWETLGNLYNFIDYRGKTPFKIKSGIRLITAKNVKNRFLSIEPEDFISKEEYSERMTRGFPTKGDLLFTTEAPLGNICELNVNEELISTGQRLITFQAYTNEVNNTLFMDFMLSPHFQKILVRQATGMTAKGIKSSRLRNIPIPVPPLEEQKVIATTVKKLFAICDRLETQITQNQTHANQLMQAVLKEAFTQTEDEPQATDNVIELKPSNTKQTDYYKRTLLAAEIVDQLHNEPTFGHLKLQKIIFLCQKTQNMELPTNFLQQAAGPYNPQMARSLDKQLKEKQWYDYNSSATLKYRPLNEAGSHTDDYQKYFQSDLDGIKHLIALFKTKKSSEMEAVATLYACWEEILNSSTSFSKSALIEKFYNWSEEKRKFSERQLNQVIEWMEEHGISPKQSEAAC